jgi:beta-galactosidase/beta-glucuronidase
MTHLSMLPRLCYLLTFLAIGGLLSGQSLDPWQDPTIFAEGQVPPHATLVPFAQPPAKSLLDRDQSSRIFSLNGRWAFRWLPHPLAENDDFTRLAYNASDWDSVDVPGHWALQGDYEAPVFSLLGLPFRASPPRVPHLDNPTGLYRKSVNLPRDWDKKRVSIHFDGVATAFFLWVNGRAVGYHQGSTVPAAFDLTDYLRRGPNLLTIKVLSYCDGSYLEAQEGWQLGGIFRDVYLVARPDLHLHDVQVITDFDDDYRNAELRLNLDLRTSTPDASVRCLVKVTLTDAEDRLIMEEEWKIKEKESQYPLPVRWSLRTPRPWSAERPYLYQLHIDIQDLDGTPLEAINQPVGFRELTQEGGRLLLNGDPLTFRGVTYRAWDPDRGQAIPEADMRRDLLLMKQHNINAVRMDQGPLGATWLALCDQLGLYLIEEASVVSPGLPAAGAPRWEPAIIDRVSDMVARDRNHPSLLIWSLGALEGLETEMAAMAQAIQVMDSTRPIYQVNTLAPGPATLRPVALAGQAASAYPLIWAASPRATGNGLGTIEASWQAAAARPNWQGGFISTWVDHGLRRSLPNGPRYLAMGSAVDHLPHDGSAPFAGLVDADRQPQPELLTAKRVMQPAIFALDAAAPLAVTLTNDYDYLSMAWLDLHWQLLADGQVIQSGGMPVDLLLPRKLRRFVLPVEQSSVAEGKELVLTLSLRTRQAQPWAPIGHEVAWDQFVLRSGKPMAPGPAISPFSVVESATGLQVQAGALKMSFDKGRLLLQSLTYRDQDLMSQAPRPNLWRAPLDHDEANPGLANRWRAAGLDTLRFRLSNVLIERLDSTQVSIRYEGSLLGSEAQMAYTLQYLIHASGEMEVSQSVYPQGKWPTLPRVGMAWSLSRTFDQMTWYGRGPVESYADRKLGARLGRFTATVGEQYVYPLPQEYGNHVETRWLQLRNRQGYGLELLGDSLFQFSVHPYSLMNLSTATYQHELVPAATHTLYVDQMQAGIGGEEGPVPTQSPTKAYHLRFRLRPLDPSEVATPRSGP